MLQRNKMLLRTKTFRWCSDPSHKKAIQLIWSYQWRPHIDHGNPWWLCMAWWINHPNSNYMQCILFPLWLMENLVCLKFNKINNACSLSIYPWMRIVHKICTLVWWYWNTICIWFALSNFKSPRTTSLCSHIFLVLRDHGVYMYVCLHLKMEFRLCARGRQWCGIIHYYGWTASIKPRLLFSCAGYMYASWGLSLISV